ncbi:MAG TPA: glycosyltransferase [Aliidongia sp.]|uniref:glycosyltransferase n=1 Tax=Aliidongia sp. TaxID=1914230 RepID=UPI002DDCAFB5|nr:glycosyltransferase [Aliidongia sp.]HEV2673662.1 glycosyltransferase [Aliidongia sp.]
MKLVVEGWRSLSHSYAIVNQWQLLALRRRRGIEMRTRDLPFFNPLWRRQQGLFPPESARVLQAIKPPQSDFAPAATLRISFPYDLTPALTGRTFVYGTAEHRVVPRSFLASGTSLRAALADPSLTILTPTHWSAEGFQRLGFDDTQIAVIAHGIDPALFRPRPEKRDAMRQELGVSGFVFMSAGAMTSNKGMDLLLRAFAAVADRYNHVRLLLKGADRLYSSQHFIQQALSSLTRSQANLVVKRLVYGGEALSMEQMSGLYQAADAYVSPYRAEGFNLPVLEATACGLPVICTHGGATDDFVTDAFARRIESRPRPVTIDDAVGVALEPDIDHLTDLMRRMVDDDGFRRQAATEGPRHAVENFTWDHAVDRLLPRLFPEAA